MVFSSRFLELILVSQAYKWWYDPLFLSTCSLLDDMVLFLLIWFYITDEVVETMNYGILYLDHKELVVGIGKLIYSCCSVYLLLILLIYVPCISLCIPGEMICNHENIFIFPLVLANFEKSVDNISNGHCNFMDASGPLCLQRWI